MRGSRRLRGLRPKILMMMTRTTAAGSAYPGADLATQGTRAAQKYVLMTLAFVGLDAWTATPDHVYNDVNPGVGAEMVNE